MTVLNVQTVSKRFGKKEILKGISLSVESGEIVGLVWPNGAGKTTLLKQIAGFQFPSSGKITVCGFDTARDHENAARHMACLIEAPGLYPNVSGRRHLEMFCAARGVPEAVIGEVADFLNFQNQLSARTRTYSVGMKQRLGLALCWVSRPDLLVLDEPLNGLDPDGIFLLRGRIEKAAAAGAGVLLSSHLLDELQKVATRIVFIRKGEIAGEFRSGDADALERRYRELFPASGKENGQDESGVGA